MDRKNSELGVSTLQIQQDCLQVTWHDEHLSRYPGIWLLEACQCNLCGETLTALRHTRLIDKPQSPRIETAACNHGKLELDEFYSRLRILYALRNDPRQWMTFRKD